MSVARCPRFRHTCAPTTASKSLQLFQAKVVPPSLLAGVKVHNSLRGILCSSRPSKGCSFCWGVQLHCVDALSPLRHTLVNLSMGDQGPHAVTQIASSYASGCMNVEDPHNPNGSETHVVLSFMQPG